MKYNKLGNTGLYVSELCLGTMTFGDATGSRFEAIAGLTEAESRRLVDISIENGINFFDTANGYSGGNSEIILGKVLKGRRDKNVVATKVFMPTGADINDRGLSRFHIMREVEASLKRLDMDYIDLYQVHCYDVYTPVEETLRALDDLVRQGKVRYIGASNFASWQFMKAAGVSKLLGLEEFQTLQAYYCLVARELERDIIPALNDLQKNVMVWSPLAGGYLSGKYRKGEKGRRNSFDFPQVDDAKGLKVLSVLDDVAKKHNTTVASISVAWLLHQPVVSTVIIGAKNETQLLQNIESTKVVLDKDDLKVIDEVSKIDVEYPQMFFDRLAMPKGDKKN